MCGAGDHQSTRSTWKSVRKRSDNSLGKMDSLDDDGEKKLEEHFPTAGTYTYKRMTRAKPTAGKKRA